MELFYKNICKNTKYKNIVNKGGGKVASTLKNFINPLKAKLSEKYIRQKIKDVLYTIQKRIPNDILELLVERLLEDTDLFINILDLQTGEIILLECEQKEEVEKIDQIKKVNYLKDLYGKYLEEKN